MYSVIMKYINEKRLSRRLTAIILVIMLFLCINLTVFAEGINPDETTISDQIVSESIVQEETQEESSIISDEEKPGEDNEIIIQSGEVSKKDEETLEEDKSPVKDQEKSLDNNDNINQETADSDSEKLSEDIQVKNQEELKTNDTKATKQTTVASGQCGNNAYYYIYDDGTLEIDGYGSMWNSQPGWFGFEDFVTKVVIGGSVLNVSQGAFVSFDNIKQVFLSEYVRMIGLAAFANCTKLTNVYGGSDVYYIDQYAFFGTSLKSYPFGNNVWYIDGAAFANCSSFNNKYPSNLVHKNDVNGDGYLDYQRYSGISVDDFALMEGQSRYIWIDIPEEEDFVYTSFFDYVSIDIEDDSIVDYFYDEDDDIYLEALSSGTTNVTIYTLDNNVATFKVTVVPYETFTLEAEKSGTSVVLNWSGFSWAQKYDLIRFFEEGESPGDVFAETTELTYTVPLYGGTNRFRVFAYNDDIGMYYYSDLEIGDVIVTSENPFIDVKNGASYYKHLMWAYNKGVIKGTTAATFNPNGDCKRCDLAVMLYRMYGKPSISGMSIPFTDVKSSDYFYSAVVWAYNKGYIKGTSATTFKPKGSITRQDMVVILWRINGSKKVNIVNPFTDVAESSYAYKAIMWAYANKITSGTSATKFSPKSNCLRYQLAVFLHKFNDIQHVIA